MKIGEFEGAYGFLLLIPERNVASVDIDDVQWRTNTLLVAAQYGTQEQLKLLYDNDTLKKFVMKWYQKGIAGLYHRHQEMEVYSIWLYLQQPFKLLVKTLLYLEPKQCTFEHIYFVMLSSIVFGRYVYESKHIFGKILAIEIPVDCDVVITVEFDICFNP